MTTPDMRAGALARLRSGCVLISHAEELGPGALRDGRPHVVEALVRSTREGAAPHKVRLMNGRLECSCGPAVDCVHRYAVRLVTGGASC